MATSEGITLYNAVEENRVGVLLFRLAQECTNRGNQEQSQTWLNIALTIGKVSSEVCHLSGETGNVLRAMVRSAGPNADFGTRGQTDDA